MISQTPMSADEFYQTFLSILQVHGFVALPAGNVDQDPAGRHRTPAARPMTCPKS